MHNEFDKEEKYGLYRSVKEILHPTISKKNISNYKIIVDENVLPLRVFYPKKITNLNGTVIYIPGDAKVTSSNNKYSEISSNLSKIIDKIVITIDYEEIKGNLKELQDKIYKTIKFIYNSLIDLKIDKNKIILMGDSTGSTMLINLQEKMSKDNIKVGKMILFYPVLSGEYFNKSKYQSINESKNNHNKLVKRLNEYYKEMTTEEEYKKVFPLLNSKKISFTNTLLLVGNMDPLLDENKEYAENNNLKLNIIDFADHGFLNSNDKEIINEYTEALSIFINEENN